MYDSEFKVLTTLNQYLANNENCWLITVVSTWGSSPRPPGSIMIVSEKGDICGSVSGGCVEEDLIARLNDNFFDNKQVHQYRYGETKITDTDKNDEKLGLPCGGLLNLLIENIECNEDNKRRFSQLSNDIADKLCIERKLLINDNIITDSIFSRTNKVSRPYLDDKTFKQYFGPDFLLILIGANQIAQYMCQFALSLGYKIIVCDPRPQAIDNFFANSPELKECITASSEMPDDLVNILKGKQENSYGAVVTLSHDPRVDDMALMAALKLDFAYTGSLGSKRTSKARRQRLQQLDLSEAQIEKLHAPVGIDIPSKTPAEIAIAVIADLIKHKNKQSLS